MSAEPRKNGRWLARWRDHEGNKLSAGYYDSKEEAEAAAKYARRRYEIQEEKAKAIKAAAERAEKARQLPPPKVFLDEYEETQYQPGMTLSEYFYKVWLPSGQVHRATAYDYESIFRKWVNPTLGDLPVTSITGPMVRRCVRNAEKTSANRAAKTKACIGSIFRSLIEEEAVARNPAHGIKVRVAEAKNKPLLDAAEFMLIVDELPNEPARVFARLMAATGARFGEATEWRVSDFEPRTKEITIARRVSQIPRKYTGNGERVLITATSKSGKSRSVVLSDRAAEMLSKHIEENQLQSEDLLFSRALIFPEITLKPGAKGGTYHIGTRTFVHGTLHSYVKGKCRCENCRAAKSEYARRYNLSKRMEDEEYATAPYINWPEPEYGKEHLKHDEWNKILASAVRAAGIGWNVRTHDLRHAHATALVQQVDLYEAMTRLGHSSILVTQKYLKRVDAQRSKAAKASDAYLGT